MKISFSVTDEDAIQRLLDHLCEPTNLRPSPLACSLVEGVPAKSGPQRAPPEYDYDQQ